MKNSRFDFPLRLSIFYAVIASLWIILSDHWLAGYLNNGSNSGQTYKGLFYIAVTALFLYTLTRREREKQEQTQNTLRENEAKYRQLFEMASDTVLLIDIKSQSILEANRAACQLYGYSRDDLIQKNIRDISQATPESITDSIQSRLEFVPQHIHRKKDGTTFPVEITGRYFTRQGREVLIVVIRDISERLKIDETIRQHSREVSLLYEAGQRLGRTLDIETIYEALFDVVKRRFQCDGLFVSSYSTTDQLIRCVYARHEGERLNTAEFPPIPLQPTGTGTQSIVIRTGEPMLLGDYQAYMHTSQVHFNIGTSGIRPDDEIPEDGNVTRSALIVPLKLEDRVIGVIQVFSYQLNAYTPKDLEFMSALGPQVSVAAANALLYQEAQNQIAERQRAEEAERAQRIFAETLRDTVAAVGNMPHFDQVLDQILGNIERVIPHGTANISLIENGFARIIRCQGYADQALEDAMQAVKWPVEVLPYLREVVQTRQAFLVADIHNFYSGNEEIQFPWIRSWVAAPVRIEGEVIGLINLDSDQVGYFTLRQAEQLQAFADQTAVVVQNMRLFNAERDQRTLAEALTRTAAALTSTLDLETVMQRILSEVGQVVPHDAANIMLVEGDKARVVSTSSNEAVQDQPSLKDAVLPLSFPLLRQMFSFGLPVQVSDTLTDSNWVRRTESSWVRSYVGAPIKAHQQVIGFITLHSRIPNFFTLEHANRLKAFADQAAVALENAQLYAELRGHAAELQQRVEQRTAELSRAKTRVEAILNSASDAIILLHADGTIQQTNPAFGKMFHSSDDTALVGQPFADLFKTDLAKTVAQQIASTTEVNRFEAVARRPGDSTFDIEVVLSPVTMEHNQPALVCMMRDITERKEAERALREALREEQELGDLKTRFVSMASHEFRTPLAVILTSVDILKNYRHRLDETQITNRLFKIDKQIKHMNALLNDTLMVGRGQAGKMDFEPSRVDLDQLCQHIIEEIRQSTEANYIWHYNLDNPEQNVEVWGDEKLLRQVFTNLIANAVKYSPAGSTIHLTLSRNDTMATFRVSDEGIGISEEDQKYLFEPFHRGDNVGTIPGSGLGLAIVKQAVERHGGSITCESQLEVGSTFTVILPASTPENVTTNDLSTSGGGYGG